MPNNQFGPSPHDAAAFQIGGVDCWLDFRDSQNPQTIQESWPPGAYAQATVRIKCAFKNRFTVMRFLRGTTVLAGNKVVRIDPATYPDSTNLFCTGIGELEYIKPRRDARNWFSAEFAIIPAIFTWEPWSLLGNDPQGQNDPSGKPYTVTKYKGSAQVFQPPGGSYYYTAGPDSGKPVEDSSVGVIKPNTTITMQRMFLPYIDNSFLQSIEGNVNANPVQIGSLSYPKGCLMFFDFESEPANSGPSDDGEFAHAQNVTYTLQGNFNTDFNAIMGRDGAYHIINSVADGSGNFPFPYSDWYDLLP